MSVEESDIESLAENLRGTVLTPAEDGYADARDVWNGLIDRHPSLIVQCAGAADVIEGMEFAREFDLPLSVQGGAHNQTGSAVVEDGLVLDLSEMTSVQVDVEEKVARVEPGCRAEDLLAETQQFGLAAPTGSAGDVGIPGSTLGGAIGWIRRKHGLGIDALRSVDIVTPDGQLRRASDDRNEDLFWAVRGGGGNFGVVTAFEFDLYDVGPVVPGLGVFYPGDEAERVLEEYYKLTRAAPEEVTTMALNGHVPSLPPIPDDVAGQDAVAIMGCYAGDIEEGETALAPFRDITDPILDMSEPMPYEMFHDLGTMMYPDGRNYCHRSVYVDDLNESLIDLVLEQGDAAPSPMAAIGVWHMGGAISDVDSDETAYPHRDAEYMITIEANWEETDDEANLEWARETDAAFRKAGGNGAYAGFTGISEQENEEWPSRVYGENFDRLLEVKRRYDPDNVLNRNVNITPADE